MHACKPDLPHCSSSRSLPKPLRKKVHTSSSGGGGGGGAGGFLSVSLLLAGSRAPSAPAVSQRPSVLADSAVKQKKAHAFRSFSYDGTLNRLLIN